MVARERVVRLRTVSSVTHARAREKRREDVVREGKERLCEKYKRRERSGTFRTRSAHRKRVSRTRAAHGVNGRGWIGHARTVGRKKLGNKKKNNNASRLITEIPRTRLETTSGGGARKNAFQAETCAVFETETNALRRKKKTRVPRTRYDVQRRDDALQLLQRL